jgi:hypothetical protein
MSWMIWMGRWTLSIGLHHETRPAHKLTSAMKALLATLHEDICALQMRREKIWKRYGVLEAALNEPSPYPTDPDDIGPLA